MSSIVIAGDTSGTVTLAAPSVAGTTTLTLPATTGTVITDATSTGINASALSTGTVPTARLASGTANSTTYLRGDQTWASVSGGVTSLNGQTGAITNTGLGDIGSYILASSTSFANSTEYTGGQTFAGSSLVRSNESPGSSTVTLGFGCGSNVTSGTTVNVVLTAFQSSYSVSGTWRLMCRVQNGNISSNGRNSMALFVRIS